MEPAEKVLTIDRSAWFMRLAAWAWGDDWPSDANFCVVFWLLVLTPFVVPFRLLGMGAVVAARALRLAGLSARMGDRLVASAESHEKAWERVGIGLVVTLAAALIGVMIYGLYELGWWTLLIPANLAWLVVGIYQDAHLPARRVHRRIVRPRVRAGPARRRRGRRRRSGR